MKDFNNLPKDHLRKLFERVEYDNPSSAFEQKLMQRIRQEALIKEKESSRKFSLALASALLISILFIGFIFYFFNPEFDFSFSWMKELYHTLLLWINNNPIYSSIVFSVLMLIFTDLFIRAKFLNSKRKKESK